MDVAATCAWTVTVSYLWIWLCVFADCSANAAITHLVARQASNSSSLDPEAGSRLPAYAGGLIVTGTFIFLFIGVLGIALCCLCYRSGWLKCRRQHGRDYYENTAESQVSLTRIKAPDDSPILPSVSVTSLIVGPGDMPAYSQPITYPISCTSVPSPSHSATDGYDPLESFSYRRGSYILSSDINLQVPPRHGTSSESVSSHCQDCGEEALAECMKIHQAVSLGRSLTLSRQQSSSLPNLCPCSKIARGSSFSKSEDFETGFLHRPTPLRPELGPELGPEQASLTQNPNAQERLVHPGTRHLILQEHTPREPKGERCGSLFSLTSQDSGASTNSAPPALTRHTLVDEKIPLVTPV